MSDELKVEYLLLEEVANRFLEGNSKKHDIGKITDSLQRFGFKDPIKLEEFGVVEGNGRLETLCQMFEQGMNPPRGIKVDKSGKWAIPVLIGVESRTKDEAIAYSIDHNAAVMWGGEFTALDYSKLFDAEALTAQLEELAVSGDLPLSIDGNSLDALLENLSKVEPLSFGDDSENNGDSEGDGGEGKITCPHCGEVIEK